MHPLLNNLSDLSDNEVEEKIIDLTRKYWKTNNPEVQNQISITIDTFRIEQEERRTKQKVQQNELSDDNSLDNLIKVS